MKERGLEVKVGILVVLSLSVLVAFVFILGDFSVSRNMMTLYVDFRTSSHLKPGAPVKINGVQAGKVVQVSYWGGRVDPELTKPPRKGKPVWIRVKLSLDPKMGATIRRNARFVITTKGVLGEKYIEISPGSVEEPKVSEGEKMKGKDLPQLEDMMMTLNTMGQSMRRILNRVDETLAKNPKVLENILKNANKALENASKMIEEVRGEVKPIVAQVKTSLKKMDKILDRTDDALKSAQFALGGGKDVRAALANVRQITVTLKRRVAALMNKVDTFIGKGNTLAQTGVDLLKDVRKEVPAITGNLKEMLVRGKSIVTKIDSGKGTVAQLINEEELYEIVKETMKNLKRHPWKLIWKQ